MNEFSGSVLFYSRQIMINLLCKYILYNECKNKVVWEWPPVNVYNIGELFMACGSCVYNKQWAIKKCSFIVPIWIFYIIWEREKYFLNAIIITDDLIVDYLFRASSFGKAFLVLEAKVPRRCRCPKWRLI